MAREAHPVPAEDGEEVVLSDLLGKVAEESDRLAEQCGLIQWSISTMLDGLDHPDLGAEIHMLQDIDRIQQTLCDVAAILSVTVFYADGAPIRKVDLSPAIRLESLRQRLGLSDPHPDDAAGAEGPDITWL